MATQTIEISETEMKEIEKAAALHGRSISRQAELWLRLGRVFENEPLLGPIKVEMALKGLIASMDLTDDEQEQYFDRMDAILSGPTPESDAFYKNMRENVGGVGMDKNGNIVRFKPEKDGSQ